MVEKQENEMVAAATLLHPTLVTGRMLSADTMPTQKKRCAEIERLKGYYLLMVKDNQPHMRQHLLDFLRMSKLSVRNGSTIKEYKKDMGVGRCVKSGPARR